MAQTAKKTLIHLLSCTALLPVSWAYAQEQPFSLDPIDVQLEDPNGAAADRESSIYVADAELESARLGDLQDVFAGIASVSVGGGIPVGQKMYVNGVDMLSLGVTIDGITQNNRAFHHVTANAIDPGLLKAVRVDAGVAGADAGAFALAGAVLFETIDAGDILQDGDNFGGNLRFGFSSNGNTTQTAITMAGREGPVEGLLYAKRADGSDYKTGGGETIDGSAADLSSYLAKAAVETLEGHRLEFTGMQLTDDSQRQYRANFGGIVGQDLETRRYDTTRTTYGLTYENTLAYGLWDPYLNIGFSESLVDVPDPYESEGTSNTVSGTAKNTFHFNTVDTIVVGVDFQNSLGRYEGPGEKYEEKSRDVGVFAQARLSPIDTLRLSAGLRADWQEFDGIGNYTTDNEGLSGNVSVAYDFLPGFTVNAGYSNVFGGIDIEDNYIYLPSWTYDELEASRAENAVAGLTWSNGALTLGAEIFKTEIKNARSATGNFNFESEGYNLSGGFGWGFGSFARMTYSDTNAKVDGETATSYDVLDFGAPLGQVIALEVQHNIPAWNMLVGGSVQAALDYDNASQTEAEDDIEIDGYTNVNIFAEYVPQNWDALTLRFEVTNLFDEDYADRASYGGDYASVIPFNEPGRSFDVTAVIRF
ncbi:TonB-dependent receptor domain-containing protein [Pseudoruegeria sp. SK021]|uniref:TonB-dependent receptor domain-containing protein n=1 Tax=Pseudoruegeria sp. SK021 TaxID=1933035 RepID=UPI000A216624|nr:TonB-dependent receptor [Pseudoruegeria sp. SK021]OSP53479.1 TonB-dependent receptor [Pseudoruegeria sp. SK021]